MSHKAGLISPCEFNNVVCRLRAFFISKVHRSSYTK